jgi:hypothetical protein
MTSSLGKNINNKEANVCMEGELWRSGNVVAL